MIEPEVCRVPWYPRQASRQATIQLLLIVYAASSLITDSGSQYYSGIIPPPNDIASRQTIKYTHC